MEIEYRWDNCPIGYPEPACPTPPRCNENCIEMTCLEIK